MSVQFRVSARIHRVVSHVSAQLRDMRAEFGMIWDVSVVSDVSAQFRVYADSFEWSAQFWMRALNLGCERSAFCVIAHCERAPSGAPFRCEAQFRMGAGQCGGIDGELCAETIK